MKTKSTKEKIFEAAIDLFSRKGYSGVSIREIARKVNIKEGSLYYHFQSKDELLHTIFEYYKSELEKTRPPEGNLDELLEAFPLETFLQKGVMRFKSYAQKERMQKISRIILIEMYRDKRARNIMIEEIYGKPFQFTVKIFEKMIKKGLIKKHNPGLLASEYLHTMLSLSIMYNLLKFDKRDTSDCEKMEDNHIRFFLNTIRTEREGK